jgi:superfamily II DNA/RNA helicase
MKFDEYRIAPEIKRYLAAMGLRRPTDIQFEAIPPGLNGEDGKTWGQVLNDQVLIIDDNA